MTISPTTGLAMYVDDNLVVSDATVNAAENYNGYWEIGCGTGPNWRAANGTTVYNIPQYFTGQLQLYCGAHNSAVSSAS